MLFQKQLRAIKHALIRLRLPRGVAAGKGVLVRPPFHIPFGRGIAIGKNTTILDGAYIMLIKEYGGVQHTPSISIGDDVYIGRDLYIASMGEVTIGDGCGLSDHVYLNDSDHSLDWSLGHITKRPMTTKGPIHIGPNCYIGYRVAILSGVTLGECCVVGVNSVVTRSFPAYSMIGGAPARLLRTFDHATRTWVPPPDPSSTMDEQFASEPVFHEPRPERRH